ncbi:MAG: MoaD/ThiS family protein [Bacteroidia bacterium]
MKTTILFFGMLAEAAGTNEVEVENITDTDALVDYIVKQYPLLNNKTYRIAVNKKLITSKEQLNEGDTIALLPPFAGG